ncbi:MAG: DUF4168 domain-containing protein [Limnoraphis sp. WC205]|jgi:hypothetical protein|nr:DUF4168 domain-containing protein [Limnoraphis sp. WC205]
MKTHTQLSSLNWYHAISKTLGVSVISIVSLLSGLTPTLSGQDLSFGVSAVHAQVNQNFSNEEITNYARVVLALESRRYQVFNEIKKIVGEVPRIVCDEPGSINALPGNAPQLAVSYCDQAKQVIEARGLTVTRFNEITLRQQNDPQFRQKIQAEILRLMESSNP